ncbi:MAG: hypothetical protein ACRYGA_05905 [Janthinobacterium lividum]
MRASYGTEMVGRTASKFARPFWGERRELPELPGHVIPGAQRFNA